LLNVQGLKTKRTDKLKSPELQYIFNSHDIVLFTETWSNESVDLHVNNFQYYALHRTQNKKSSKRDSGGIIVYLRENFVSNDTLVFQSDDDILCIRISGNLLSLQNDLYVCLCYAVPENSSRQSMIETIMFDRLTDFITSLGSTCEENLNLMLFGDMNAHTSNYPDFVTDDNYCTHMNVLPVDYDIDPVMNRYSQDKCRVNSYGLTLLDICKHTGLRILNSRFGKDKYIGRNTFVGSRGSSLVDYVISTQNLFQYIDVFEVQDPNILSDHCLVDISLVFNKPLSVHVQNAKPCETLDSFKYVWNNGKKQMFAENLSSENTMNKLNYFNVKVNNVKSSSDIDECINDFSNIFDGVASPLFKKDIKHADSDTSASHIVDCKWYTQECFELRNTFHKMLNVYRNNKSDFNRQNMVHARTKYKSCIRKCKMDYDRNETAKLTDAKHKNVKLYWKMLKTCAGVKQSN
jgi:hypothetical protein